MKRIATALAASLALTMPALAIDWNFYHHQSAPLFATSRGARMLSEQIEKDTKDRKSTRLNSSHDQISYAVFCLKKKNTAVQQSSGCTGTRRTSTRNHRSYVSARQS